jgi:hemoglobin
MTTIDRRAQARAEIVEKTGIDEALIERLVRAFYARIRADDMLGPIFNERIDDWEFHIQRLCAFWSSVALSTGAYSGSPMQKHLRLPIDGRHFDHWLGLFRQTATEICPPVAADFLIERADRIAESLELALAGEHGVLLFKGDRLRRPDDQVSLPNR